MTGIPIPPPLAIDSMVAYVLAGVGVLLGVALLFWGRVLGRTFLMLCGAGAGATLAGPLATSAGIPPLIVRIAAAVLVGIICLIAAPVIWALLAACSAAAGALWALLWFYQPMSWPQDQTGQESLASYLATFARVVWDGATDMWGLNPPLVGGTLGVAVAAPLVLGMLWRRLCKIVVTALLGAVLLVAGLVLAVTTHRPDMGASLWSRGQWVALVVGVLVLLGIACQYRRAIVLGREKAQREAQEESEASGADEANDEEVDKPKTDAEPSKS